MPSLFRGLRSSSILQAPTASDKSWFQLESRPKTGDVDVGDRVRLRAASLAVVLREPRGGHGRVEILLIKRAVNPRDAWSGHVALPGGRQEIGETELQTAVRECEEEVGVQLLPSRFNLLGRLRDRKTSRSKSALAVSCFVFAQKDSSALAVTTQESEVAYAWWVDTALFYPQAIPTEIGFSLANMVKAARKPQWKMLARLLGAETVFVPCFYLPSPPPHQTVAASTVTSDSVTTPNTVKSTGGATELPSIIAADLKSNDPHDAKSFVLWGLTFGVVSDIAVAGGGRGFASKEPPYFRFRSTAVDFVIGSYYKLQAWGMDLTRSLSSTLRSLRLRR